MQRKIETEKNLHSAFAGESMANRKYLYFAKVARQLGNDEIARLFEETAHQETGHAFAHLEQLSTTIIGNHCVLPLYDQITAPSIGK